MIPPRFAPIAFGLILSCMMSFLISGVATARAIGFVEGMSGIWMQAWISSWIVAFPAVTLLAPFTRRVVARLTRN